MKIQMLSFLILFSLSAQAQEYNKNLLKAAKIGDFQEVQKALASGAQVDCVDKYKKTALIRAATHLPVKCMWFTTLASATLDKQKTVKILLASGASPNSKDFKGCTPLSLALLANHAEITKMLLEAGADTALTFKEPYSRFDFFNENQETETILDYTKHECCKPAIRKVVQRYSSLKQEVAAQPTKAHLEEALELGFSKLVEQLLLEIKTSVDEEKKYAARAEYLYGITQDASYQVIGKILKHRIGLVTDASGISKHGIIGGQTASGQTIPADIAHTIRIVS